MSSNIGEKIRNVREALEMGRQEYVEKIEIPIMRGFNIKALQRFTLQYKQLQPLAAL